MTISSEFLSSGSNIPIKPVTSITGSSSTVVSTTGRRMTTVSVVSPISLPTPVGPSTIHPAPNQIILYSDSGYRGTVVTITGLVNVTDASSIFNSNTGITSHLLIKSFKIGSDLDVKLYRQSHLQDLIKSLKGPVDNPDAKNLHIMSIGISSKGINLEEFSSSTSFWLILLIFLFLILGYFYYQYRKSS